MQDGETQVAVTLEIQFVVGVDEKEWTHDKLEEHLNEVNNVDLKIEGLTQYAPDGVECTYLEEF